ncbi:M23 family metallopeptidase [Rhodobacteraceae bacterium B1Z28]|uniref:M23 family metallopeptidase n=1 Tax=Ruegeria haliotis TaxID=2747601 RepID=A0ABX2PWE3_9RHOB|nr:M23 family metallopeptidase [Ruegeria haliotis]NVO58353.1 M23 family metallopeptidase [Ruegeria haliotis]
MIDSQWLALILTFGLPLLFAIDLTLRRPRNWADWLLRSALLLSLSTFLFLGGVVWLDIGLPWRWILIVLAVAATIWSCPIRRSAETQYVPNRWGGWISLMAFALPTALFLTNLLKILTAGSVPADAVNLALPLSGDRIAVMQGGQSIILNHHFTTPSQKYATDLVALWPDGQRAKTVSSSNPEDYAIFGMPVIAPCEGDVLATRDDLPETPIGGANLQAPAGNFVLLSCDGITVLLAHLQPGSLSVDAGTGVGTGQELGLVGNSGNSTEPHLHVHAVEGQVDDINAAISTATAVPITFDGLFLTRNMVLR